MGHLICKCRACLRAYVMLANARTDLARPHEVLPIVLNYSKSSLHIRLEFQNPIPSS